MKTDSALQLAEKLLEPWAASTQNPETIRLDVSIAAKDLVLAVKALEDKHWGYLSAITGLDLGVEAGELEVLYHFCSGAAVTTLRVRLPRKDPVIASVCGIIPSATLFERELIEMFGISITDTPNTDHLILPDEWPEGVYPLRKDFGVPTQVTE